MAKGFQGKFFRTDNGPVRRWTDRSDEPEPGEMAPAAKDVARRHRRNREARRARRQNRIR